MKLVRYLALAVGDSAAGAARLRQFTDLISHLDGIGTAYEDAQFHLVTGAGHAVGLDGDGVVVGTLFPRDGTDAIRHLDRDGIDRTRASRGVYLTERCWGPYVAFIRNRESGGIDIVRSPLGALPCFLIEIEGGLVLTSDIALPVACGLLSPAVDWEEVVRHLLVRDLARPETCLAGVRELRGGLRLSLSSNGRSVEEIWSPWSLARHDCQVEDRDAAAAMVRRAAGQCVDGYASGEAGLLLMLSGGLDSSILAACLASGGTRSGCLTLVGEDATGDERLYARAVCEALGLPLAEGWRDLSRIDIGRSDSAHLPRPNVRMFFQESRRLAQEAATATGASAIFNGGGGDHIFCSLQSGAPAADRLLTDGPGRSFWKTCQDISLLAPASLTAVAGDAIRRAWLGKPPFRALRDPALLSAEAAGKPAEVPHPWLRLPPGALPGKAQQVRLLALAQGLAEGGDPQDPLPMASPLLAQPLAEACLRVPSWLWFAGGHNRVVARHAFEGRLPANVLWRRSKGTPDGFAARIFDANRTALREMLAGGELARRGLIDLKAVFEVIDDPRPVHGDGFRRVLQFADVEAWARGWSQASGTSISLALR